QRYVCIIWRPHTMSCSRATRCAGIPLGICNNLDSTTMPTVIAVDNFLPEWGGNEHILVPFHINDIRNALFLVKRIDNRFLDIFKVELKGIYECVIEM